MKKRFLGYIHNFRGIAILFVVGGHILLSWPENEHPLAKDVLYSIWQNGTVLFVFIAGYLFQYLIGKYRTFDYWKKKLRYVILPYLLISGPAIIIRISSPPHQLVNSFQEYFEYNIVVKILLLLVTGAHLLPLWFVPMIFIFYLVAPVLAYLDRNPFYYRFILPFLILISLVFPRGDLHLIPANFIHFSSVYVFGMFFSHYNEAVVEWLGRHKILLSALTVILFITAIFSAQNEFYNHIMYVQKMVFCCFSVYWLFYFQEQIPKSANKLFGVLADYSFGVFFLHYYILLALKRGFEHIKPEILEGGYINWLLQFTLVVGLNLVLVYIIKKITESNSRYLIGC